MIRRGTVSREMRLQIVDEIPSSINLNSITEIYRIGICKFKIKQSLNPMITQ